MYHDNAIGPAAKRSNNVQDSLNHSDEHADAISRFCGNGNSRDSRRLSDFVAISEGRESRDDDDDDEPPGYKRSEIEQDNDNIGDYPKVAVNKLLGSQTGKAAPKAVNPQVKQATHMSSSLASAAAAAATTATMEDMKELMRAAQIMMNIKPAVTGSRGNGKRSNRTKEASEVKEEFTKSITATAVATSATESTGNISSSSSSLPKVTISLPVQHEPKIRKRRGPLAGGISIFSAEDDRRLIEVVHDSAFQGNEHRHQRSATSGSLRVGVNWVLISKEIFQNRFTPRGLRNRYVRTLHPNLKHEPWTEDEDQKLMELATKNGNKWTLISGEFNNTRSDWMCKRRYLQLKKQAQTKGGAISTPTMKSQPAEASVGASAAGGTNGDDVKGSKSDNVSSQYEPLSKRVKHSVIESSTSPLSPLTPSTSLFTKTQSAIISQLFPPSKTSDSSMDTLAAMQSQQYNRSQTVVHNPGHLPPQKETEQIRIKEQQSQEPGQVDHPQQQHLWKQIQHHVDPRYMSHLERPLVIVCPPDQLSMQPSALHAVVENASLVEQTNEAAKRFMEEQLTEIQRQSKGHIVAKVMLLSDAHVCAIRIVPLDIEMAFDQLLVELSRRFSREILQASARLQYIDRDGDVVDLKNSEEWAMMKQEFFTILSSDPSIRLQIMVHI